MKKLFVLLPLLLNGCGDRKPAADAGGNYKDLPQVPGPVPGVDAPSGTNPEEMPPDYVGGVDEPVNPQMNVCAYWNSLPSDPTKGSMFQIVDALGVTNGIVTGRHIPGRLPQLRHKLAQAPLPFEPMSLDEFMKTVRAECKAGNVSWIDCAGAEVLYLASKVDSGSKKKLLGIRNDKIMSAVEEQLPGAFLGRTGPLAKSPLMAMFLESANLPSLRPTDVAALQPLARAVNLFSGSDFNTRRKDIDQSLAALEPVAARKDLPLEERACRFALAHRVTAQMLTYKGMSQTPATKSNGLFADIAVEDITSFPKVNEPGAYGRVVERTWLLEQLEHPTARPLGAESTENFLQALRFYVGWTAHRHPDLWQLQGEATVPGTIQLDGQLLELGMGFFGVTAQLMANEELHVGDDKRISLRQDTSHNLYVLTELSFDILSSFRSLSSPNEVELALIGPSKIDGSFLAPYPDGLLAKFDLLVTGLVFEGFARLKVGDDEELKNMIRLIGRRIGNARLANLQ